MSLRSGECYQTGWHTIMYEMQGAVGMASEQVVPAIMQSCLRFCET